MARAATMTEQRTAITLNVGQIPDKLWVLVRALKNGGAENQLTKHAVQACNQLIEKIPLPFSLQFSKFSLYLNHVYVPLEASELATLQRVTDLLELSGMNAILFKSSYSEASLIKLCTALSRSEKGQRIGESESDFPGVQVARVPVLEKVSDGQNIQPAHLAAATLQSAITDAEILRETVEASSWSLHHSVSSARWLKRAMDIDPVAVRRILELNHNVSKPVHRALSAGSLAIEVLRSLGVSEEDCAMASHCSICLGVAGYQASEGGDLPEVSREVWNRIIGSVSADDVPLGTHLRAMLILLDTLSDPEKSERSPLPLLGLIHLLYYLEQYRCPNPGGIVLGLIDLLSFGHQHRDSYFDGQWIDLLMKVVGPIPIGTHVTDKEGNRAVVMGKPEENSPFRCLLSYGENMTRLGEIDQVVLPSER